MPPGVHPHPLDDGPELHQHVVGEQRRVGQDHPLDRRVRDVALVPQGDVLQARLQVRSHHPGQPAQLLGLHRVALVGHGRAALLGALAERLLDLADLGALEVADLQGERLDGGGDRGAGVEELGVAVAGEHLGGRHRRQAQRVAHVALHGRVDVAVGADRPRELADGDGRPGSPQPLDVAAHLQRPQGELVAERRGLGVDPVGAPDHRRVAELVGPPGDGDVELLGRPDQQVGGPGQGEGEGGVDDVRRRQAVVDPSAGRLAHPLLHHVDEGGHVVLGRALALLDGGDVGRGPFPDGRSVLGGHDAERGPRLDGQDLDLDPGRKPHLVRKQVGHGGKAVARDQRERPPGRWSAGRTG